MINDLEDMDYPAAHSMDTTWFAVDKDGYIAAMDSEEVGAVPCAYGGDQGDGSEFLQVLAQHLGKPFPKEMYPDNAEGEFTKSLGLYLYRSGFGLYPPIADGSVEVDVDDEPEDIVEAYQRIAAPVEPLHISKLPESFQAEAKHAMAFNMSFKDAEWLQPALSVPCGYWITDDVVPKAVDIDGHVKVIPENLRQENAPPPTYKSQLPKPEKVLEENPWWKKFFG